MSRPQLHEPEKGPSRPGRNRRRPVIVELQREVCLVDTGDVTADLEHTHTVTARLPRDPRTSPIVDPSRTAVGTVPAAEKRRDSARSFDVRLPWLHGDVKEHESTHAPAVF